MGSTRGGDRQLHREVKQAKDRSTGLNAPRANWEKEDTGESNEGGGDDLKGPRGTKDTE